MAYAHVSAPTVQHGKPFDVGSHLMSRIRHDLIFAAAAAALFAPLLLFAQPALAQTHAVHSHRAGHWNYYDAADVYGRRDVAVILDEVARSPFYGQFGGYEDAYAASRYFGPNQRHYFGYGP
jgi:hypothetical protein